MFKKIWAFPPCFSFRISDCFSLRLQCLSEFCDPLSSRQPLQSPFTDRQRCCLPAGCTTAPDLWFACFTVPVGMHACACGCAGACAWCAMVWMHLLVGNQKLGYCACTLCDTHRLPLLFGMCLGLHPPASQTAGTAGASRRKYPRLVREPKSCPQQLWAGTGPGWPLLFSRV